MSDKFSFINTTSEKLPVVFSIAKLEEIKDDILGKAYTLSIALVDKKTSKKINAEYRKKDKPTNVLSFSLHKNEGELVLCPSVIQTQTKKFGRNFKELFGFLVIHGMLHLKSMEHGEEMEKMENKYSKKYLSRTKFLIK